MIDDLQRMGADGVRQVVNWWSGLNDSTRQLVITVGTSTTAVFVAVLTKILNSVFGQFIGICLLGLLAGASWALLIKAFLHCAGVL